MTQPIALPALVLHRIIVVVANGAIVVSMSEFWFYQVGADVSHIGILVIYGVLGYLFVAMNDRLCITTWPRFILSAAILGFLIEGVAVPVVYSALPLTLIWTSLAWHMLFSVLIGWVLFRRVMTAGSLPAALSFNAALGIFLGFWNGYSWNAQELAGSDAVTFDWLPLAPFVLQFLFGYLLFLAGHVLIDRVWQQSPLIGRAEHGVLWGLATAISVITAVASGLLVFYPAFLVAVALCMIILVRSQSNDTPTRQRIIPRTHRPAIPAIRYTVSLLIPLCAIASYALMVGRQWALEMNVLVILTAGPLSVGVLLTALILATGNRRS